jgi:hypothetical protein
MAGVWGREKGKIPPPASQVSARNSRNCWDTILDLDLNIDATK